ncbi:helicase DnaB modulator [Helicobacter pylori]|uniref:helicase DnaB modulator n=1 Tax=Helicobacter pylori TaxID=210 RepID=UPI0029298863|nr:helicase DnaB modulator [Helicobacter pylori]MDU9775512.1 helicase DnaB modulator [Helicobacter pylori]
MPGPKPGALPLGDTPKTKRNIIQKLFKKVKLKRYNSIMENGFNPLIYKRYLKKKETFLLFKKIAQVSAFKNLKLQLKRREVINHYVSGILGNLKIGFRYAKIEHQILKIYFTHPSFLKAFKIEEDYYTNNLKAHFKEVQKTLKALNYPFDFKTIQASVKKRAYEKPVEKKETPPKSVNVNCEGLSDFTKKQFLKLKRACNDNTPRTPLES